MDFYGKLEYLMNRDNIKNLNVLSDMSGIPYTTLKGFYTRGAEHIKLSTLERLKAFFNTTLDYLTDDSVVDPSFERQPDAFVPSEKAMVKKYRVLDPHGKKTVDIVLDHEHERCTGGEEFAEELEPTVSVKVYDEPAAAGRGTYLSDDVGYEMIKFKESDVPRGTSVGIRIEGDSMEPDIEDGDVVFIEYMPQIENGQIGVFMYSGKAFCKKLCLDHDRREIRLVSLNKKYKDILVDDLDGNQFWTVGKVLV